MSQIELTQISKTYPRQPAAAVDGVTLEVAAGSLTALLGPSGSGKSTVLKLIAGIELPDAGEIYLGGQPMLHVPAHQRGAVLMFQKAYLFPFLSVAENIGFGLKLQGARRETIRAEVSRMLALVELPGFEKRRPAQLSGGEQQRIALARALVTRPRVLLLDEPLSSLDTAVRVTLQEAICRIQRELGITTLLVTHDQAEALSMADQVAMLDQGKLLAQGTPRQLFLRPPSRRTAQLMGISTFLDGTLVHGILHTIHGLFRVCTSEIGDGAATFAIRPEHIYLRDVPDQNTLAAHVIRVSYRGEQSEIHLRAGALMVRVRVTEESVLAEGSQVYLQFPQEHLFPVDSR